MQSALILDSNRADLQARFEIMEEIYGFMHTNQGTTDFDLVFYAKAINVCPILSFNHSK